MSGAGRRLIFALCAPREFWYREMVGERKGRPMLATLTNLAHLLGLDPFQYLLVTLGGIMVWTWCTVISDVALTGRGVWLRWSSLAVACLGAVMFAYTARLLY